MDLKLGIFEKSLYAGSYMLRTELSRRMWFLLSARTLAIFYAYSIFLTSR